MSDYGLFAHENFDPDDYASSVLAGDVYQPSAQGSTSKPPNAAPKLPTSDALDKEDISVAISKLTFGIDDVSKQIKTLVTDHHEDLLSQAANARALSGSLGSARAGLSDLDVSLDKLRSKIRLPYQSLDTNVSRLQRLQQTSDLLRRTSRFVVLARRLQNQMAEMDSGNEATSPPENGGLKSPALGPETEDEKERAIARAALSIAELVTLVDGPRQTETPINVESGARSPTEQQQKDSTLPLRSIQAVSEHIKFIEDSRTRVTTEMENMVLIGLANLDQSLLASSLQTAYNLQVLPELVQSLVIDLSQAVEERIRSAFDLSKISKDVQGKDTSTTLQHSSSIYKSRVRTEPTNMNAPQYAAALWNRLEQMITEMSDCCVKVYTLEKVLKIKKDAVTGAPFLDEAMKALENKPSATFWTSLGSALEKHARDAAKSSSFLQQTLGSGYPKLLRLFHEFFAKIAVHTDTVYMQNQQSPETVLVLRALSNFESSYLARSLNKLNEAIGQAFAGGSRTPPSLNDAINIARTVTNELDSARFDPLLVRSVAKNVNSSLEMMISRAESTAVRDRSAVTLLGPSATSAQITNGALATFTHQCWSRLQALSGEHAESVYAIVKPNIQSIFAFYEKMVDPILNAIRRELGAIIAKLHRIDFAKPIDPLSGGGGGSSFYMQDLVDKMSYVKSEVLSRFNVGQATEGWILSIVQYVIRTFVLHISIAKPLGESGKLQLTNDMTELEFAISAFMSDPSQGGRGGNLDSLGDDYRALRAMRPLLFLENSQLASPKHTSGLPPLIVLHHILVRSPVPLPHEVHGWQEAEYVRWVNEHSEGEAWSLVESGLSRWDQINQGEGKEITGEAEEYVLLAKKVLENCQTG